MSKGDQGSRPGRRNFLKSTGAIAAGLLAPAAASPLSAEPQSAAADRHQVGGSMPTRNLGKTGHRVESSRLGASLHLSTRTTRRLRFR